MTRILTFTAVAFLLGSASVFAGPPPTPTKADVSYGPDPRQLMDIYVPPGAGPFPVIISYGNIWIAKKPGGATGRLFPAHCASVSVETRGMTDAVKDKIDPPISVVCLDARRALQFVRLHAREWNLDPDRIGVTGSSQASIPTLYVACAGEQADPKSADPVERASTKVLCAGSWRGPGSIDPKVLLEWDPGDKWGAPALGCSFDDSLKRRDELLPLINKWSPDALLTKDAPPIYIQYNWPISKPADVAQVDYTVHSPLLALGFQKLAQKRGATCYVNFPGHPSKKYTDMWDFLIQILTATAAKPS
jgi:hypothetical protein